MGPRGIRAPAGPPGGVGATAAGRAGGEPGDEAIRERLRKQRAWLFGCLYEPAAEPTNNRAERALRSGGDRPEALVRQQDGVGEALLGGAGERGGDLPAGTARTSSTGSPPDSPRTLPARHV